MKQFQLVILGCLVALVACKPAEDVGTAQLLLRSCDHNADDALNAAEFAGCLMQASAQQSSAAQRTGVSRTELLQSFMDEADLNNDLRADEAELQEWSERWFIGDLFGAVANGTKAGITIQKIIVILQYIGEANYSGAVVELYALISGNKLSASSQASISLAITAINQRNYGQAIGFIYSVIREIAGGDNAGGIFVVSASTVTNVASLLQAAIQGNSSSINLYIYRSLAGIIVDFTFLSQASASYISALIQAVIENNSAEVYVSLKSIIVNIEGISEETATALTGLLDVVIAGQTDQIIVKISAVLRAVLKDQNAAEIVQIFGAVIQAVIAGDSAEAISQLTLLYAKVTGGGQSNGSKTVESFTAIIKALQQGNSAVAVAQLNVLIQSGTSGLSSSQISSLRTIVQTIQSADNYTEAIALLVAAATSGGGSSGFSVEVYLALSSVITVLQGGGDSAGAVLIIEKMLSNSSLTINSEVRDAFRALIVSLSEGTTNEALAIGIAIASGSSKVFNRTISAQVTSALNLTLAALNGNDTAGAIVILEALLKGERGGSSLSIVVKNDLKKLLKALKSNDKLKAYAQLSIISLGKRSSSLSVSVTTAYLVAIELVSSGSASGAVAELELLLKDDDIESSFKLKISAIIQDIKGNKTSKALNALAVSLVGSSYSFTSSVSRSIIRALGLVISGDFEGAITVIQTIFNNVSVDIHLLFIYVIYLLREGNVQGALAIINVIIAQAASL